MMMMMTYRRSTREERTLINRALDRWGAFEFFQDKVIFLWKTATRDRGRLPCAAGNYYYYYY